MVWVVCMETYMGTAAMKKFKISKLFLDIRTYFVLFVIVLFSLGFLYNYIQEGYRIVEVLETKTEPAIKLKVTKVQLDRADINVDDSYKKDYNRSDYNNGNITGDLYYDYYFSDGSSTYERISLSRVFDHDMPGVGSTAQRNPFTRGKYRTRNGQIEEVISSATLKMGDSINQSFSHTYTWQDIKPYTDDIGALIYAEQRVSNGKVSTHQTVRTYINIKP